MKKKKNNFEIVDHTADLKIRIYGKTKKELFLNAVLAMESYIFESLPQKAKLNKSRKINLKAASLEDLFLDWLSEIIFLIFSKHEACLKIEIEKLSQKELSARLYCTKATPKREIKAATYHNLKIKKVKNIWRTDVVFDI